MVEVIINSWASCKTLCFSCWSSHFSVQTLFFSAWRLDSNKKINLI